MYHLTRWQCSLFWTGCHHFLIMSMVMAYCWPMHFHLSMSPTKPLYVNETGLLLGMGKLNDFISYMYCIGTLVNVYWIYLKAPAATITFKRLASLIAEKQQQDYNKTIAWIRCLLSFSLVRSSVMCLRGARSSYHRPAKPDFDTPLDVALSDGHVPTHWIAPYGPVLSHIFHHSYFLDYSGFVPCNISCTKKKKLNLPWKELWNSWLGALPRKQKSAVEVKVHHAS